MSGCLDLGAHFSESLFLVSRKLVELKNGETFNGLLVSCDNFMNINLREVICTSRDGDKFTKIKECYIRGSTIKYLRIPDEVIDQVKEDAHSRSSKKDFKRGPPPSSRGGKIYQGGDRSNFGPKMGGNKFIKKN